MTLRDQILARLDCADAVAAKDCYAIAALLSEGRTRPRRVAIDEIQARLDSTGEWGEIEAVAADPEHPAQQAAAAVVHVGFKARYLNIDMQLPRVQMMFGALVQTGKISQETFDFFNALSVEPDPLSAADVADALFEFDGTPKWL
jgi:hypothetical protein